MSLSYLNKLLPLPQDAPDAPDDCQTSPDQLFVELSDTDLGVITARFLRFLEAIKPLRTQLEPVGASLRDFSANVSQLSASLTNLRSQSEALSKDLSVQRRIVEQLNTILLDLLIPPAMAVSVANDPVDEAWLENIRFIVEKQQLVKKINDSDAPLQHHDTAALRDLTAGLDLLESKAVERIRDHVIAQIRLLRLSSMTASQVVQERLIRVKEVFVFLKLRQPRLAAQLQLAYIYTMKWYYTTRFAKYLYSLQKLKLKIIDLLFVLGAANDHADNKLGVFGFMDTGSASPGAGSRLPLAEYFLSVDKRMSTLQNTEDELGRKCIPSQIAESSPFSYWPEFLFKQWSNALLDNIIVEYLFFVDFFYQGAEKFEPISALDPASSTLPDSDWCQYMFAEIFSIGRSLVNWLATTLVQTLGARLASGAKAHFNIASCDSYAILIIIRTIQKANFSLHNEFHIPVMDEYHNSLVLLLWPHFTKIIDLNCDALKKNALASQAHRTLSKSLAPTNTTQQFALFLSGLLKLAFARDDTDPKEVQGEPICTSIIRLRNEFESTLTKTSSQVFGSSNSKAAQREMFLFNNFFLIATILRNDFEDSPVAFIKEQVDHFAMLCDAYKPK